MTVTATRPAAVASPNPQSVAKSDVKPSELVEAVVALNMETSPKTPKRPLAAQIQVEDHEDVDSGYASKSSTPENSNFGPFVVANTPLLSLTRRKKTKLTHFEKEIPKLTQNRFEDLRELYADSLNKLASGISKRRGILMTLKVLGESEKTAEPWVFIQCDKAIAKKVRRFFKQSSVVSDFKPPSPNNFTPKLDVYVHELPLLLLGGNSPLSSTSTNPSPSTLGSVELYYQLDSKPGGSLSGSLSGSKIAVTVAGQRRLATIGGFISIETKGGDIQDLGITAGHFLNEDFHMENFDEEVQEELEADDEENDDDPDDEVFDDGQDFELDLGSLEEPASTTAVQKPAAQSAAPINIKSSIGRVFWTSQTNRLDRPNLDWALFTIENNTLDLSNIVMVDEITKINTEDVEEARDVVISTASRGLSPGTLSSSWSYLTLAPGNGMVRTKAVKLAWNQVLEPGDSGAWVVDTITNQLYGHVVASDVFGVCYIVPASDVFSDIQQRLSARTVKLPSRTLSIFELQVPSTNDLSQYQVSKAETRHKAPVPTQMNGNIGGLLASEVSIRRHSTFEQTASSSTQPASPKSKDNFLVRVLRIFGMRKRSSEVARLSEAIAKDVIISSEERASKYGQRVPSPGPSPNVPNEAFSDSGYSTMANTPAGSKRTSPRGSDTRQLGVEASGVHRT